MISLEPIGYVRSSRADLPDDNWGSAPARLELVESLPAESLDGIEAFSHAEVIYLFDRVRDAVNERGDLRMAGEAIHVFVSATPLP